MIDSMMMMSGNLTDFASAGDMCNPCVAMLAADVISTFDVIIQAKGESAAACFHTLQETVF